MFHKTRPIVFLLAGLAAFSCATQQKLKRVVTGQTAEVQLTLGEQQENYVPEIKVDQALDRDTLTVLDEKGKEILLMKAVKDEETGEMVAHDVIDAAKVTARFRNVAERNGKVDLAFQIIVPESMTDSKWQLRFYPELFMLGDSTRLEPVMITGSRYRKEQLRGYERYNRFLEKIISDTTRFVDLRALEIFLQRNIPELYALRTDSSYVSENEFYSMFGVNKQEAVEHYTNQLAKRQNERRIRNRDAMYRKYVKVPIVTEGIRLDSIIVDQNGDFVYNYVQTINTRPKLRKANIVLSGEIYEQEQRLYTIPKTDSLTFYISSLSAFTDQTERYLTKVIERRAEANTECHIDFALGRSDIDLQLGDNYFEIRRIRQTLAELLENEVFDLDSIVVSATASPEGAYRVNARLADQRSASVSDHFNRFIRHFADSLVREAGISMNLDGSGIGMKKKVQEIRFTPRSIPENWEDLDRYAQADPVLNVDQKASIRQFCQDSEDPDVKESLMRSADYYGYVREFIYPKLRTVKFNFYLHRKGMVKDTVHTTAIDSTYMRGVQALKEMDYAGALALLSPYKDFNTAVAYLGMDRNRNALAILKKMEPTPKVNYLLAIVHSRLGKVDKAVEFYLKACRQDRSFVYRGNLDPEISVLIKTYGLGRQLTSE